MGVCPLSSAAPAGVCVCDMNHHKSSTSLVALAAAAAAAVGPVLIVSAGSLSDSRELVGFWTTKVTLTNSH